MSNRKYFHGTMNASKSAQLLMQVYNLERQGKTFLIFKPSMDTRDEGYVKSRALDEKRIAHAIDKDTNGLMFELADDFKPDFIFVDELQFFTPKQVEELTEISIELSIPIFAYGLMVSYTGDMFDSSKKAIETGFTLHELKMQCDFCVEKSTHHLLYINGELQVDGEPIFVGDLEFKSVCYKCFLDKRKK